MRNLLLALVCAGSLACGAAYAANNDVLELGLGARMLFDSDTYTSKNPDVNYESDAFPIMGDQAFGIGATVAVGHRFNSRRGPWEFLVKYIYSTSAEDNGVVTLPSASGDIDVDLAGKLDEHDLFITFRMPSSLVPVPILNYKDFYYDLGLGVTTLSYDYSYEYLGTEIYQTTRTRSGLAYNLGMGWKHEIAEDWALNLRADFVISKIQDIEDASGAVVHASPNAHGARLQVGLVHYFKALF